MESNILGSRYELIERIGMGGMAVVYKAKDIMLGRFVAVKILREEFKENEDFIRRFKVESQAAASLSHQNITQIYDVGEQDGLHYIVMEYLEGQTLKNYILENDGALSWKEAANFSMQICRALEHAHSKHVVHRDIKPQNIVLTENGKLKVADFGIARAANNTTTVNMGSSAVGSAHYLSPEQARGGYTDLRSDIYSLGVVMYEMFTGTLPFDAEESVSVIMQHLNDEPKRPCDINPDLPAGIEAIIIKAMKKEQRLRYENTSQILEDLITVYQNPSQDITLLNAWDDDTEKEPPKKAAPVHRERKAIPHKKKKSKVSRSIIAAAVFISSTMLIFIGFILYLLFFGTGSEVEIPDLLGMTYEEAALEAENASEGDVVFEVFVERSEHSEKDKSTIISQIPEGGSKVKRSREIKVVLSLGPAVLELEDYTGKQYEKVQETLEKKGVKVIIEEKDNDTYEEGIIFRQVPSEGTQMAKGDEVTLYVSKGTQNTVVPNVLGKTLEEAIVAIERNNLKVGTVKEEASDKYLKGEVSSQSKAAFETVPIGTQINLSVSTGKKTDVENENGGDTISPTDNPKKSVKLTLGNLPKDRDKVNIRLVLDGKTYYEKDFSTQSGSATITVETNETLSLDVYYDGVYITTKEVKY